MEVDCQGCAGCCLDWRPLADGSLDHERRGRQPLDDTYNLVPLERDEIRSFVDAGLADALVPRLWLGEGGVSVGDSELAAIAGRPAFGIGLRTAPKPVGPFGHDPTWLSSCVFLDPTTLQCRIHGEDLYPDTCRTYPGTNLRLAVETECERVEREHGGRRLRDDEPPADAMPRFGPDALGTTVFAHPDPERIADAVERLRETRATAADRAEFAAVAAAASPGTTAIEEQYYERARERVREADSWVGRAIDEWESRAETTDPVPSMADAVEVRRGAPATPGWDDD